MADEDDEISYGPKRDFRLPQMPQLPQLPRRWLAVAAVAVLVAVTGVVTATRAGHHATPAPRGPTALTARAAPGPGSYPALGPYPPARSSGPPLIPAPGWPPTTPAPGTVLLTCASAVWGQLDPDWHTASLRVGSLWFIAARQLGYVRLGRAAGRTTGHGGTAAPDRTVEMLVHLDAGSTVVLRAAAGAGPVRFFDPLASQNPPPSDQGFTFVPCPGGGGPQGLTAEYEVGFSLTPGHPATVEVLSSASARPAWLTFTA